MAKLSNDNIAKFKPQTRNGNKHTQRGMGMLESSMRQYGYVSPMTAAADGEIIDGSARIETSANVFGDDAIVVHHDGTKPIIMVRDDIPSADTPEARAISMAANRIAQVNLDFDAEVILGDLAAGVNLSQFWRQDELDELLADLQPKTTGDTAPETDRAEELRQKWQTAPGQLWQLGEHRLICGDCTDPATVARVMGGEKAQLLFTSPPYAQQRDYTAEATEVLNDWDSLMQGAISAAQCSDDAQILVNLGLVHRDGEWLPYWDKWIEWMRAQGWRRFGWYVWDQGPGMPGDWGGRLAPSFEFVFHFNRVAVKPSKARESIHAGERHGGKGQRGKDGEVKLRSHGHAPVQSHAIHDSVIRVYRQGAAHDAYGHPAPFPPGLPELVIESWGGDVYEPFSGSGTTIIACENLGRRCRACEISPGYVGVALERYFQHTGVQPVLLESAAR